MRNLSLKIALFLGLSLSVSCRSNVFEPVEDPNPADQATAYMDQQKPDEAISVLNSALKSDPNNYQLISLMA
ncbi:MAG: tetratricopeptide repeat protein, partial [Proteobacteria bacterium]